MSVSGSDRTIPGTVYQARSSKRARASLARRGPQLVLTAEDGKTGAVAIAEVEPGIAAVPDTLTLTDGRRFIPDTPVPADFLPGRGQSASRAIGWLERLRGPQILIILVLAMGAFGAVRYGLPLLADGATALIPYTAERQLGVAVLAGLEDQAFEDSSLAAERRDALRAEALDLADLAGLGQTPEILFRSMPGIGANALALPGGIVVISDQLIALMPSDDAILAVVAHEYGHVDERHGLRRLLRVAGLGLLITMAFGADQSLLEELTGLAVAAGSAAYSRAFEREADTYAADLLAQAGRDPTALADALDALHAACAPSCGDQGWFSTHPGLEERVRALR